MMTAGVGKRFQHKSSSTVDSTKLHKRDGVPSQAGAAVVAMDTDMKDRGAGLAHW